MAERRKLAAILAADVVGYSRLTGADEDRTLARLRALRSDLIDPTIAVHNGRVVKRTGDGALVEFRSVVDAVRCAIEVQNAMVERNAGLPPERRIEFRIGIHLGDVVEESDGDLMGDGVNIASRLEGVAAPGAICLSEDAYRQVRARLDLAVSDLGETQLKNIAEPMRVYSLAGRRRRTGEARDASGVRAAGVRPPRLPALPDKPSIAVLPFTNMSRRSGTGVFRRRNGRGHHHGPLPIQPAVRDRAKFDLYLQGPGGGRASGGQGTGRALRAGGRRPQVGKSVAHHGPADRRGDRRPSVGRQVRRRPGRCL